MENNNKEPKSLSYHLAQAFITVLGISIMSIIAALTVKIIMWIV